MNYTIEVSVIMAVYNTDFKLVKRAIDSVLNQDFTNFELIIIDDGSDNDIHNHLINYVKKFGNKIIYLRHKNCGQSKSINKGILNSRGKYITVIDGDDEYKVNHLSGCLKEMNNADLIASTTQTIVNSIEDYFVPDKFDHAKKIHIDDCILFATLFGKKEVFHSYSFESIYGADALFYEKAAQNYKVKKVNLGTYIYYRTSPTSACSVLKKNTALQFSVS
jgi:glycosyltransferase involved in cell wall biosynthesis